MINIRKLYTAIGFFSYCNRLFFHQLYKPILFAIDKVMLHSLLLEMFKFTTLYFFHSCKSNGQVIKLPVLV